MTTRELCIICFTVMLITQNMFVTAVPVTSISVESTAEVINEVTTSVSESAIEETTSLPELLSENELRGVEEPVDVPCDRPSDGPQGEASSEPCNAFEKIQVLVKEFSTELLTE